MKEYNEHYAKDSDPWETRNKFCKHKIAQAYCLNGWD